jgi:hypothetical protein
VSKANAEEVRLKVVGKKEYEEFHVKEKGTEKASVEWWSSSYDALKDGECEIDDMTLESILKEAGRSPKPLAETIDEMMR